MQKVASLPQRQRVGVIVLSSPKLNDPALRCLILAMNKEQEIFEFEIYDVSDFSHSLIDKLSDASGLVDRDKVREELPGFVPAGADSAATSGTRQMPSPAATSPNRAGHHRTVYLMTGLVRVGQALN